jgi:hypothetical protein
MCTYIFLSVDFKNGMCAVQMVLILDFLLTNIMHVFASHPKQAPLCGYNDLFSVFNHE